MTRSVSLRASALVALAVSAMFFTTVPAYGEELIAPVLIADSPAEYPAELRGSGRVADISLDLTVDQDGVVTHVTIVQSSDTAFDLAAIGAARHLTFEPGRRDGKAIRSTIRFSYHFEDPGVLEHVEETSPQERAQGPDDTVHPGSVTASPAATSESTELEVDVLGDRPPREPTMRTLQREEIRKVPGTGGDVIRAVETLPGVARPPGLGPDIVVRGSSPRDTQVFVDGSWIPSAYHFGGLRTVLPSEVLERLDFYPGNFGPQYGRGMGGVIDVGVRSPRKDRIGGLAQIDLLDGRALVEGPLDSHTRFLAGARRSWIDAWVGSVLEGTGTRTRTAPAYYDWQAVLERDLSPRTTARLLWFGSDDRLAIVADAGNAADPLLTGELGTQSSFQRLQARIDTRFESGGRITSHVAWGTQVEKFNLGDQYADASYHFLEARSDLRVPIAQGMAIGGGLDVFYATYDAKLRVGPYPGTDEVMGPYFARPPRRVEASGGAARPAVYVYSELSPSRGLRIVPSLRSDYSEDTRRVTFDPRLSARWQLHDSPRTTVKSAIGIYHQPPQPVESLPPFGTPGIRSSSAIHASTGIEQELVRGLELSLETYVKRLTDLVIARPSEIDTAIGARFDNTGSGSVVGGEALVRVRTGRLSGWAAYSLSRSIRRDESGEPYRLSPWDQTHVASAVANVDLGRGWTTGGRLRYITGTPITPYAGGVVDVDAGAYAPVPGRRNEDRMPPFYQLDLRIEKVWNLSERARFSVYLDVQNATNRQNPEGLVYRYDYARRDVASGLPILPILGLRGEL